MDNAIVLGIAILYGDYWRCREGKARMASVDKAGFVFGTHYEYCFGGNHWCPAWRPQNVNDWRIDMRKIRETGFDTIRARIGFDSKLDEVEQFLDIVYETDLRVIYGFATFYVPQWFIDRHPDSLVVDHTGFTMCGEPCEHRWPRVSLSHPEYRRMRDELLAESAKRFCRHPAVFCWDVHNEPHIGLGQYTDYNQHAIGCFRKLLEQKYSTIEELNRQWGSDFRSFEKVAPAREPVPDWNSPWGQWRQFCIDTLSEFLNSGAEIIRKNAPGVEVTYNATSWQHPVIAGLDWWNIRNMNWPTLSLYADSGQRSPMSYHLVDMLRSIVPDRPVWITEAAAGPYPAQLPIWTGKNIELETWSGILHGVKGIVLYRWEPLLIENEALVNAMVEVDTDDTERRIRTKGTIARIREYEDFIFSAEPVRSRIAIYLPRHHVFEASINDSDLYKSVCGWYGLLGDGGFGQRFICDRLRKGIDAKLLVVPFSQALDDDEWSALTDFAKGGGRIIMEIPTENETKAERVASRLGVKVRLFDKRPDTWDGWHLLRADGRSGGFAHERRVLVESEDMKPYALYQGCAKPALFTQWDGRLLAATFPAGLSYWKFLHRGLRKLLSDWMESCGIEPEIKVEGIIDEYKPLVEVGALVKKEKALVIVVNRSPYAFKPRITVKGFGAVTLECPAFEAKQVFANIFKE